MNKIMKSIKQRLLANRWAMDSLAIISIPFSSLMRPGILFFHQGRCGSSVVANLLGQHPKIRSYEEIFNPFFRDKEKHLPTTPENMLRERRVRAFPNFAVVEAKFLECLDPSVLGLSIGEFVDLVKRCGYRKFIILDRQNYLRRQISREIGWRRGKWRYTLKEDTTQLTNICLDVENIQIAEKTAPIVDMFKYMDEQYQKLRIELAGEDVLEITYEEDIFNDPKVAYTKVCHWLGIESLPVQVKHKKTQNVTELNELVENWSEVLEALTGTQYAWMVSSDPSEVRPR